MFQPWTKDFVFQRLAGLRLAAFSSANPSSAFSLKGKPLTSDFVLEVSGVINETELHSARQLGCEYLKWRLLGIVTSVLAKKETQRGPVVPKNSCYWYQKKSYKHVGKGRTFVMRSFLNTEV